MLPLYLFCLIVGGGLLLFSLFASDGGETEVDGPAADVEAASDALLAARDFLSVRALIYFLAGFGATGSLLRLLTDAGPLPALLWATATGLMAATAAGVLYGWLRRSESGLVSTDTDYLVGVSARVVVPVQRGQRGKILAVYSGREVELLARLHSPDDGECPRGAEVVIVDLDGETALVTPMPLLPSSDPLPE